MDMVNRVGIGLVAGRAREENWDNCNRTRIKKIDCKPGSG